MTDEFKYDVFLSHSSKDKDIVRDIANRLEADGINVWFDEWEIKAGDHIPVKIEEGLKNSRILVLCMSVNAFGSEWAQLESHTFRFKDPLNKKRRFIPLRLDDATIDGSLANFSYISWLSNVRDQEYPKLLNACQDSRDSSGTANDEEGDKSIRNHLGRLVSARRKEWERLRKEFETEAGKYNDVELHVYYITPTGSTYDVKFPEPNHAINLWQYYGDASTEETELTSERITKFGLTGAEFSAFGVLAGERTDLFRKMATRAGSLLLDEVPKNTTLQVCRKFAMAFGWTEPIFVSNSNPLAKWLNLTLVATATCNPERYKDGVLGTDPFALSLTVFDYFCLAA